LTLEDKNGHDHVGTQDWQVVSLADQRPWVRATAGGPPAEGVALALAWRQNGKDEDPETQFLVSDTNGKKKAEWVKGTNVDGISIRAPRSTAALTNHRIWASAADAASTDAEGPVLAVRSDEVTTEYLVCDARKTNGTEKLCWLKEEEIEKAWIHQPEASLKPTKKVTAATIGTVLAGAAATAATIPIDSGAVPEVGVSGFVVALITFLAGYFRSDPKALGTPAAASEGTTPPAT
jgi:hypothetical protein